MLLKCSWISNYSLNNQLLSSKCLPQWLMTWVKWSLSSLTLLICKVMSPLTVDEELNQDYRIRKRWKACLWVKEFLRFTIRTYSQTKDIAAKDLKLWQLIKSNLLKYLDWSHRWMSYSCSRRKCLISNWSLKFGSKVQRQACKTQLANWLTMLWILSRSNH